jgi:hypothetical protein
MNHVGLYLTAGLWFVGGGCSDETTSLPANELDTGVADALPDAPASADADAPPDAPAPASADGKPWQDGQPDSAAERSADLPLDLPITADMAPDQPISLDAQDGPSPTPPSIDAAIEAMPFEAGASEVATLDAPREGGSVCQSAARLFACMWDDTTTSERTWLASQDMTIHGVVTLTMLSAGANWCSVRLGLTDDAQTGTHSLIVSDETGHLWYPQYYVQSPRIPWRVGDAVDIRYQVTVAGDGRPRRAMALSSAGRVIVYVAEAVALEDFPPPPVALRLAGSACPSGACGGGRYGLLAGSDGVAIPYGQAMNVEGYRILNADCADVASGICDSQPSRISVAMVYDQPTLDAGAD